MKRLPISTTALIAAAQTCGAKPIKIEAVAASIAQLYCKGAQFEQGDGEKLFG